MATTTVNLKLCEFDSKRKTKSSTIKNSIDEILESVKDSRGFYLWPDLVGQLQLHFDLTKIQAAVEIRALANKGKILQVPCTLTADIAFTKGRTVTKSSVYATEEEEKQIREPDKQLLHQLHTHIDHLKRKSSQRGYNKDREELLAK